MVAFFRFESVTFFRVLKEMYLRHQLRLLSESLFHGHLNLDKAGIDLRTLSTLEFNSSNPDRVYRYETKISSLKCGRLTAHKTKSHVDGSEEDEG